MRYKVLSIFAALFCVSNSAPPHSPNFCTDFVCLEVLPTPNIEKGGFIRPDFSLVGKGKRRTISADYDGIGRIYISNFEDPAMPVAARVSVRPSCQGAVSCGTLYVAATSNNAGYKAQDLICLVNAIWVTGQDYVASDGKISNQYSDFFSARASGGVCTFQHD